MKNSHNGNNTEVFGSMFSVYFASVAKEQQVVRGTSISFSSIDKFDKSEREREYLSCTSRSISLSPWTQTIRHSCARKSSWVKDFLSVHHRDLKPFFSLCVLIWNVSEIRDNSSRNFFYVFSFHYQLSLVLKNMIDVVTKKNIS